VEINEINEATLKLDTNIRKNSDLCPMEGGLQSGINEKNKVLNRFFKSYNTPPDQSYLRNCDDYASLSTWLGRCE